MADRVQDLIEKLRVKPGAKVKLKDHDPRDKSRFKDEEETKVETAALAREIDVLQDRLYAEGSRALLVILQGTDTSGKDGTIRGVFNATGPLGVSVHAFGPPSTLELEHDYLWRVHAACPRRGTIGIFNRSHYEDVLIGRVKKLAPDKIIEQRYDQINDFERMLVECGTTILKFFLHISKSEQRERLQARLDEPGKRWKFEHGDLEERKLWSAYMKAYTDVLEKNSTPWAPWTIVPADKKWFRNYVVAKTIVEALDDLHMKYPKPKLSTEVIE